MITNKNDMASSDTLKAWRFRFLLVPFVLLTSSFSSAVELNITAEFKPDPLKPGSNSFKNTTPNSGYCQIYPEQCNTTFSLLLPNFKTEPHPILANHTDKRQGAMFSVPAEWREFEVISSEGKSETVEVRISGFGARYVVDPSVRPITGEASDGLGHNVLWGASWVYAASPCTHTGVGAYTPTWYRFFWKTPTTGSCGKTAKFDIPEFSFEDVNIMYDLKTPKPLDMPKGVYIGQLIYRIGPGLDFDFGDVQIPSANTLTLNFTLTVVHILAVRFPPGADRLTLVPAGGWLQWLNRGRRPEKLSADQDFQIWSSAPFKMLLQCEHAFGNQCAIQNKDGHSVPVETRVTLPSGVLTETNTPVNRHLLTTDPSNFHPSDYIDNGKATLEFEVGRDSVQEMTEHAGKQYTGDVTVVWDTEI